MFFDPATPLKSFTYIVWPVLGSCGRSRIDVPDPLFTMTLSIVAEEFIWVFFPGVTSIVSTL
jgi:hypothetical protein